jgi:hypothetical protein
MLLALVIGYPCLRLKGPYFAISMLGLNEVVRALVSYFETSPAAAPASAPPIVATVPVYYAMGPSRWPCRSPLPHHHLALRPAPHDHPRG